MEYFQIFTMYEATVTSVAIPLCIDALTKKWENGGHA